MTYQIYKSINRPFEEVVMETTKKESVLAFIACIKTSAKKHGLSFGMISDFDFYTVDNHGIVTKYNVEAR